MTIAACRASARPRPCPAWPVHRLAGLTLLLFCSASSRVAASGNDACLRCHGMATLARRSDAGEVESLAVDPTAFSQSEHGRLRCLYCHGKSYTRYPHPAGMEKPRCTTCHSVRGPELARTAFSEIQAAFEQSVHVRRLGQRFTCARCHDPHAFRRWREASLQSIAGQNRVCLACHDSAARFTSLAGRGLPDLRDAHAWLPHPDLHWRHVRCLDCHGAGGSPGQSHRILPALQATRDCVACHSTNSVLKEKLYRHRRSEEAARLGFANAVIVNDAYVIGATRNRYLDLGGGALVGAALLGVAAHGLVRAGRSRRRIGRKGGARQ